MELVKPLFGFVRRIYEQREMVWALALRAIQTRYVGTLGGFIWSVLNPLLLILVYWFIFSVGFKAQPVGNVPFIAVFLCGFVAWSLLQETLTANVQAVTGSGHLVKKIVFPTEILPAVHVVAGLVTHGIMLIILLVVLFASRIAVTPYALQFFYYAAALSVLCLGLGWLVAALNVFSRDVAQAVGVLLNIWFWMTPVVWGMNIIPERIAVFMKLNPMYYIVEGYKDSFIYQAPFWGSPRLTFYYWTVALVIFALGGFVFRKLKREFADVL